MRRKSLLSSYLKMCLPYIVILLMGFIVFLKPLGNGDELWNYNFARNIAQGNVPYRDFSIVQTPLSCFISGVFLWILGDGLFAFRVVSYLLFLVIAILIFRLCKNATKSKSMALCATLFVMSSHFLWFIYNYNYLSVLILLIIFLLEHRDTHRLHNDLTIGLLVGICTLIKQNTGIFIMLANLVICLRMLSKPSLRKNCLIRLCFSVIPVIVFAIYLLLTSAFCDFIDYAVLGIATFVHRYSIIDFFNDSAFFAPYLLLIIVMIVMMGIKLVKNGVSDYQFSILLFSMAWLSVAYPLADVSHILLVLFPLVPAYFFFYPYERMKRREIFYATALSFSALLLVITLQMPNKIHFHISRTNNYGGVLMDESWESVIETVGNYIVQKEKEGYTVRIADANAAVFKIPLDKYEKNWDMLLVGNLGSNSISDLLHSDGPAIYLVLNHEQSYGLQDHHELICYIKENFQCIDDVAGFSVYEGK